MLLCTVQSFGQIDETRFKSDLRAIAEPLSRSIGSVGYDATARWLQAEIRKLPNVELQVQEFPVVVPVTKSATLAFGDGSSEQVYPFWPAGARVCSTPAEGIRGQLIYCGDARIDQIPIGRIAGQIAVVESTSRYAWTRAISSGARAIIVLGSDDANNVDLRNHDIRIPINLPRFYLPEGKLANELRTNPNSREATLRASVSWETRTAINLYALVKPNKSDQSHRAALMLYAPFDSTSLVPDLAPGASQAVQTASALAILRDLNRSPPDRPTVVCFGGADGIQLLGTRQMLLALAEAPRTWLREMGELSRKQSEAYQARYRANEVRDYPERLDGRRDRALLDRMTRLIDLDLKLVQDELFRRRAAAQDASELEQRQGALNRLRSSTRTDPGAGALIDRTVAHLDELLAQYAARKGVLDRRVELYQWLARALGRNAEPAEDDSTNRLLEAVIGIDLSDRGRRIGPMTEGLFQRTTSIGDVQDYLTWLNRAARERGNWFDAIRETIDLEPPEQSRSMQSYLCANLPLSTELTQAWGVPGFSLVTLDDLRLRRDTPADTLEQVNVDAILPQLRAVRQIVLRAANDSTFTGPTDRKRRRASIPGQVVSLAPGKPIADLGRPGFLISYQYVATAVSMYPKLRPMPWTLGVRRNEQTACDADGNYLIEGLPQLHNDLQLFAITANRVDPASGAITATTDLGKQTGEIKIYRDIKSAITPVQSLVFDCDEIALTGVIDPRFMQPLNELTLLDARRKAEPQRFCFYLHDRLFAGFIDPGMPADYAFRYGRLGNRLLLRNRDGESASAGVSTPLQFQTTRDFWTLNDQRLAQYRRAGVSSTVIDAMHEQSSRDLRAALDAMKENHSDTFAKSAELAWSNEVRVYDAVRDLADDVVRGAIFLLLLCVPFAFCMERLLIGTANVYRQIIGASAIFAIMLAALWSFHPAFKISASPMIVVLAFAIIFMSLLVIVVLYNKFDVELKRVRAQSAHAGRYATGSGRAPTGVLDNPISLSRAGVLGNAILLGIANMRRRKLRTALTSITIVLITFAILCFTSSTSYLDTIALPTGEPSNNQHELLLRQRGHRAIPPDIADSLKAAVGRDKPIIERWWNVSSADPKDQIALIPSPGTPGEGRGEGASLQRSSSLAKPQIVPLRGLLGLSSSDNLGPAFARLDTNDRDIIYLSDATAAQLNAKQGDHLRIGGIDVEIAGIFNADQFDRTFRTIAGEQPGPLLYLRDAIDTGGRKLDDAAPESFELSDAGAAELHANYEHLSSRDFAIVPAALSRYLPNASLRSVSVRLNNESEVKALSDLVARRFALAVFAAGYDKAGDDEDDGGVRMVTAGNLTRVSGAGQVAIPLVIAGLIVFNTMMGSIAERRREIHVYTSLGLAPLHVGALFLAEASVYGLLGTVFGYVIGQAAGTLLTKLGWLGDVTMNYSGTSAILTMSSMLAIVLLSALIPARIASKIASPSIERTWQVPPPVDDTIVATLPFTITRTAADGAIAYLTEFFESHSDAAIGKFAAGPVRAIQSTDPAARGLATEIWLTPFDLGIRQQLTLLIKEGEFQDIFEVEVQLVRSSGDPRTWHRSNRPFLAEIRKQFLQWRTLSLERMRSYATQSQGLVEQV